MAQGLAHLVAPLLLSHPQLDSVPLAEHVEQAGASGRLPGGARLAEQLLRRLGAHEPLCRLLLRHGRARCALRLARQQQLVGHLGTEALLEASAATGDALLFAAAHRALQAGGALPPLAEAAAASKRHFEPLLLDALQAAAR